MRPHGKGVLKPRHNMIIGGEGTRGGLMGDPRVEAKPRLRACGARPSAGGLAQHGWPSGEDMGPTREADFLGGAHSVRPHCEAVRKPRHNVIIKGQSNARWPSGDMLG